jgi:hypothetical protein
MKIKNSIGLKQVFVLSCATVLLTSCGGEQGENPDNLISSDGSQNKVVKINDEIYSVPSPIQFTSLIKESGSLYNKEILNSVSKASQYSNNFSKSLNLGIYGADLSYTIIYDQTQHSFQYLNAIKKLADPLGLEGVFDEAVLTRFNKNSGNQDSLHVIIADAYLAGDAYLKDNDRMNTSGLILAGSWIEGLYLATSIYKIKPNDYIKFRIAEQKSSLQSIIKSLTHLDVDYRFVDEFKDLATVYDSITFHYKYIPPTTDLVNHITTINSKTDVRISDEQVQLITQKISAIRNKIVDAK